MAVAAHAPCRLRELRHGFSSRIGDVWFVLRSLFTSPRPATSWAGTTFIVHSRNATLFIQPGQIIGGRGKDPWEGAAHYGRRTNMEKLDVQDWT